MMVHWRSKDNGPVPSQHGTSYNACHSYLLTLVPFPPVASLTIENYVKAIYQLSAEADAGIAATGKLAEILAVSPSTVTSMLKTLGESGLAQYTPYEGARLTDTGRSLALRVLRRHRLIELFLVQTLKLAWDEVHAEAENMEHAVSDFLINKIDDFLGRPENDPHGDPIPRADGTIAASTGVPLSALSEGERFRIVRVSDQAPDFLRYLADTGLRLGAEGTIAEIRLLAGVIVLRIGTQETTLSREIADKLVVAGNFPGPGQAGSP
jgi:DtxR family Mn-dependent transcriptional regulator